MIGDLLLVLRGWCWSTALVAEIAATFALAFALTVSIRPASRRRFQGSVGQRA